MKLIILIAYLTLTDFAKKRNPDAETINNNSFNRC